MVRKVSIVFRMPAKVSGGERNFQSFRGGWNKGEAQPNAMRFPLEAGLIEPQNFPLFLPAERQP